MPVLLNAYDVKRCARRIHNEWDPDVETEPWETPATLQMLFDKGVQFQDEICAELAQACAGAIDLNDTGPRHVIVGATLEAMAARLPLILNGWLPDDPVGGRKGRPDLLVHVGDGHYLPGEVKSHLITCQSKKATLTYSQFSAPGEPRTLAGQSTRDRLDDALQLAHYWRMLQTLGRTPDGPARGLIVGTDRVLAWADLEQPRFTTFSRSRGTAKRSALECYDHEHGFRLKVAQTAVAREPALVVPVFVDECDSCPWYDYCLSIAGEDVASANIRKGRLDLREWKALSGLGITKVDELADLDANEVFWQRYSPEVSHRKDARKRLDAAVRRACMVRDGVTLERISTGPIAVPAADVEIDFDIEWDGDENVYLWGCWITDVGQGRYYAAAEWGEISDGSIGLARTFTSWLRDEIASATQAGKTTLVYHYSAAERNQLRRLLADEVDDILEHFVDLLPIVKRHYFGLNGLGIKQVAPAFGFRWRDEDPGGLQSQVWLQQARAGDADARQRILQYNEDDVRATAALREGLRAQR